jgi:hypothetical protein
MAWRGQASNPVHWPLRDDERQFANVILWKRSVNGLAALRSSDLSQPGFAFVFRLRCLKLTFMVPLPCTRWTSALNAPEVLPPLDNDAERLERVLGCPEKVTVCFLGHSGVEEYSAECARWRQDHVLPAGGMGPLENQDRLAKNGARPMKAMDVPQATAFLKAEQEKIVRSTKLAPQ